MAIYKSKYTGAQIDALLDKMNKLEAPIVLKGRVDSEADLANIQNPQPGWMYMVGLETDTYMKEFYYTDNNEWEFMGTTNITVDSSISQGQTNPVTGGAIYDALANKQDNLAAGTGLSFGTGANANTLNHSNSITAQATSAFRQVTLDAQGHVGSSDDKITGYMINPDNPPAALDPSSDTLLSALGKLEKFGVLNKNNILLLQQQVGYANTELEGVL